VIKTVLQTSVEQMKYLKPPVGRPDWQPGKWLIQECRSRRRDPASVIN
jgi:hypothetical protein